MFRKVFIFLIAILGFASLSQAAEDRTYGFQIPNNRADINNLLGSIPILGDVTTATDIDERIMIVEIKNGDAMLHIDGETFELGPTAPTYQFRYMNKSLELNLAEQTLVSTSLIDEDEKPKTHELKLIFDSNSYATRITALENELDASSQLISRQANLIADSEKMISNLEGNTDRMISLEGEIKAKDEKLDTLETRISGLNANITSLQDQLSETNRIITGQNAQLTEAGATINSLSQTAREVADLEKMVQERESQITVLINSIDVFKQEVFTLETALRDANTIITDQINKLAEADATKKALNSAASRVEEMERLMAEKDDRLNDLQASITTLKSEIAALENQLNKAGASLDATDQLDGESVNVSN